MGHEYEAGLKAVQLAARLCQAVRAQMLGDGSEKLDKDDRSPVTVADFGAQAVVCQVLGEQFPDDVVVGEEDSVALRAPENAAVLEQVTGFVAEAVPGADAESVCAWIDRGGKTPADRFWVLDPIDGTKGFLRNDQYAVALALIEGGEVRRGFLACPALPFRDQTGVIFVAQQGGGAQALSLDGADLGPIGVSDNADPTQARLAESVESAHTNKGLSAQLRDALGISAEPVRMDSQAKYAVVGAGLADVYLRSPNPKTPDYRENIWDHAAGWLVITEAGGRVSDVYGTPLDWTQGRRLERNIGVLATNGHLHDTIVQALAAWLPERHA